MPAESFIIRELTGSQREVRLNNRALPYRPVNYPGQQHYRKKWYPGNPVATLQVLGPREGDVEIKGAWKSRYLPGDVDLVGFDDIPNDRSDDEGFLSAENMAQVFTRLRIAGNALEVRWGQEVRRGILASFDPGYLRAEDVEWMAVFTWSSRGEAGPFRASAPVQPLTTLETANEGFELAIADEPETILARAAEVIETAVEEMRDGIVTTVDVIREIQNTTNDVQSRFQQFDSAARQVIDAGNALKRGTLDLPYQEMTPFDDIASVFQMEIFKRNLGADGGAVQSAELEARVALTGRVEPGVITEVTVRQGQTLRDIAFRFYGDVDSWPIIADANSLVSPIVEPGLVLVIPRAPEGQTGIFFER